MSKVSQQSTLAVDAAFLFDVVADVERYPEFISWCRKIAIIDSQNHDRVTHLTTMVYTKVRLLPQAIETKVRMDKAALKIDIFATIHLLKVFMANGNLNRLTMKARRLVLPRPIN